MRDECLAEVRREQDGKFTFECPLDELHSDSGNAADMGFFCTNGQPDAGEGWRMWCQHSSCSSHTDKDRAHYLDAACQKYGVEDASALVPYCLNDAEDDERSVFPNVDFDAALVRATALFEEGNLCDPRVFWNPFQACCCRIEPSKPVAELEPLRNDGQWHHELRRHVEFSHQKRDGEIYSIAASSSLIGAVRGNSSLTVPICNGIIRVPIFSRDGSLRTAKGYETSSQTYLDPWGQFHGVADVVSSEDVDSAIANLALALRDFPFSDVFIGVDPAPVRVADQVDETGFPEPNYRRGISSRAHALALLITPIVREMIDGPTPIYLIDKPKPGTGAGFILNLLSFITAGRRAPVATLGKNAEEIGKQVTAKLRSGNPLLVFDNVKVHVDSDDLAAAVTGGYWQGRILGTSNDTDIPIKATWVFSCNSGSLSTELMRRTVPIRLDAATDDPARDRPPGWFKLASLGYTYTRWLSANRIELVWAIHVLTKWWMQCRKDGYVYRGPILASFDEYSEVLGGNT